jgi:hypothetical protein
LSSRFLRQGSDQANLFYSFGSSGKQIAKGTWSLAGEIPSEDAWPGSQGQAVLWKAP